MFRGFGLSIGALIIRIGVWGILLYNYNKEPPRPLIEAPTRDTEFRTGWLPVVSRVPVVLDAGSILSQNSISLDQA